MANIRTIYEYNLLDQQHTGPQRIIYFVPIYGGGSDDVKIEANFWFQKKLESSDRRILSIKDASGTGKLKMDVLKDEERWKLMREGFLMLTTVDPKNAKYKLRFTYDDDNSEAEISEGWFELFKGNDLKEGDYVTGWGYRADDGKLCLAFSFPR